MIDAAILWDQENAYFFRGSEYFRWEIASNTIPEGYPRPIANDFQGWPEHWENVEAAVRWPNGRIYFFNSGEYIAFDVNEDRVLGPPMSVHDHWRGFPSHWNGVDAVVIWPNGRAYFFRGDEYFAFDVQQEVVLPNYPQPVRGNWRGWPEYWEHADSAIMWPNGRAYFFNGNDYLAYDPAEDTVLPDYPQSIDAGWPGLPTW